ncbi:hypothetical protein LUZ60_005813 [Juncus effusus]|nr:hypothetical protein LUZ60_005813 [Juncus effusus]
MPSINPQTKPNPIQSKSKSKSPLIPSTMEPIPAKWVPQPAGPEIAFFDTETSVPARKGEGYALLEFGAVLVCPKRLTELFSYSTLIKPANLDAITVASVRCNGITREAVGSAPGFGEVADDVYTILHGRVWAGHNIIRFDCPRIKEAFNEIGRPAPEPKGLIDTLPLLTQRFGRRAGDMKMASLANYFSLGRQSHRSLDDVKMNISVVKNCATVLFLEESLPNVLAVATPLAELPLTLTDTNILVSHIQDIKLDSIGTSTSTNNGTNKSYISVPLSEPSGSFSTFLDPSEISPQQITILPLPFNQFSKTALFHNDLPLQLFCKDLKVRFGVSDKFTDNFGKPKLSFVADVSEKVCEVLEACDELAMRWSQGAGSGSQWRDLVKKNGFVNLPTVRIHIPTNGGEGIYSTEILKKEPSGSIQKLVFSKLDTSELDSLFKPGSLLDAFISLDLYDYQQNAGIRLIAKRLVLC